MEIPKEISDQTVKAAEEELKALFESMLVVPNPIEWPEYITKQENQEYAEMLKKDCQRDLEKRYSAINEINLSKDYSPLAKNDHTIIIPIKTEENKYPLCVKFYGRNIESYSEENYGI